MVCVCVCVCTHGYVYYVDMCVTCACGLWYVSGCVHVQSATCDSLSRYSRSPSPARVTNNQRDAKSETAVSSHTHKHEPQQDVQMDPTDEDDLMAKFGLPSSFDTSKVCVL
eukprot:c7043_g1_i6.p4 GENE.c7043_g1_i6~~c7043_g1_i6.p4  ORF type:complete len:111 (-),score=19.66 c7043_g1_i6:145-477(-)